VEFNRDGLRRETVPGHPLEWVLVFGIAEDGQLQATSHTAWEPTGDVSAVTFTAKGSLIFEKDYGGDSMWIYHCRTPGPKRLVCLLNGHDEFGIEFVKTS
jgi:hypothetical protein